MTLEITGINNYHFIPALTDEYYCNVCQYVLKHPKQFETCGHRVCEECFGDMKNLAAEKEEDMQCPFDDETFTIDQVFTDKAAERVILNWKVKCSNHENECTWIGPLNSVNDHEKVCGHIPDPGSIPTVRELSRKVSQLQIELNEKCAELKICKEKLSVAESAISSLKSSIYVLEMKSQRRYRELEKLIKDDEKSSEEIVSSEHPNSLSPTTDKFEWKCPKFDTDPSFSSHYSPVFYNKQYAFRLDLCFISDEISVRLHRIRGKFDLESSHIQNSFPDFKFIVIFKGKEGAEHKVEFTKDNWIIAPGYTKSYDEVHEVENWKQLIVDDCHHLHCEFVMDKKDD